MSNALSEAMNSGLNMAVKKAELLRALARRRVRRLNGSLCLRPHPGVAPGSGTAGWSGPAPVKTGC